MKLKTNNDDQIIAIAGCLNTLYNGMDTDMELYQEFGEKEVQKAIKLVRKLEKRLLKSKHSMRLNKQDQVILIKAFEDDRDRVFIENDPYYTECYNKYIAPILELLLK